MVYERMRDKVGIVTLYHGNYNFGGLLQAYALPTALNKYLGTSAEQIDYIFGAEEEQRKKEAVSIRERIYLLGILFFRRLEKGNLTRRKTVFEQFMDDIPHSKQTYDPRSISDSLKIYQKYICGGDQIWNDCQLIKWLSEEDSKVFTLQFVPEQIKKISYAPSMAVLELTDEFKADFATGINRLDAISVREKRSLPLLEEITDKPITVAVDPVFLLCENDWDSVIKHTKKRKKYVLCYLLGDHISQRKAVQQFARKLDCSIITFPHILGNVVRKCDLFFGDVHDYTSGPSEFLGLIKDAEFVITDSFHACVFSMIFKTPFVVFERNKAGEKGNMNSRIYDFLEEYHLEKQLVTERELADLKAIPEVDFTYAHEHWKKRREESLDYLEHALKDDNDGVGL